MDANTGRKDGERDAGHGLAGIPGTLTSLADVKEECQTDGNCYGNNVGFYKQAFYIFSKANGLGAPPPGTQGPVDIGKVDVSARRLTPRDTITVSATLSSGGAPVSALSAAFYDGDPEGGGARFGVERIPYLSADASYDVATTYRTNSCGTHELFVVLNEGKPNEIVRRAPPVRVDCLKVK